MSNCHSTTRRAASGFTLIEMMVVIGLVALLASMALPSIVTLLNAGADAQAYNLIAAQCTAARALAIERVNFAGVHCQLADAKETSGNLLRPKQEDVMFSGLIYYDDSTAIKVFKAYDAPKRIDGGIAFGQLTSGCASDKATVGEDDANPYTGEAGTKETFTTFSIIFTAFGSAVKSVDGGAVAFWADDPLFKDNPATTEVTGTRRLWIYDRANNHYATTAITLFEMSKYAPLSSGERLTYLNENAQFLPLNVYTGQLQIRE